MENIVSLRKFSECSRKMTLKNKSFFEFCTRATYRREQKKFGDWDKAKNVKKMEWQLADIYTKTLQEFCEYAKCNIAEFEMFCKQRAQCLEFSKK